MIGLEILSIGRTAFSNILELLNNSDKILVQTEWNKYEKDFVFIAPEMYDEVFWNLHLYRFHVQNSVHVQQSKYGIKLLKKETI